MSLITEDKIKKTEKIRVEIDATVYKEIQAYCEWAKLRSPDTFFEKSALYILTKDKKWKSSDEYSMID